MKNAWLCLFAILAASTFQACGEVRVRRQPHGFNSFGFISIINLKSRPDRLEHILNVMEAVNVTHHKVITAVQHTCGILGCGLSHLFAVEACIASRAPSCLVLEDDFSLKVGPEEASTSIDTFFHEISARKMSWDVLMISGNVLKTETTESDHFRRLIDGQTTAGYAFTQRYAKHLLLNLLHSTRNLNEECPGNGTYALDIYWKRLQPAHNWYVLNPLIGKQLASFSDIEHKQVDYGV